MDTKNRMGRWIRGAALAGSSLTMLLGAGSASAQNCPTPTLQTCNEVGYLTSACGQQHSTHCNNLIGSAYQQAWSSLTTQEVKRMPAELGGGLATSRPTPYAALGSTYVEKGGGSYAAVVLKNQLLHRKNFQNLSPSDIAHRDALQAWEQNGTNLGSCEEVVEEKFYDFNKFESRMGIHGTNYRKIFEAAYAQQDGIAYKTLKGKGGGNTLAPIFNGQMVPKNLYYMAGPAMYPPGTQGYQINPALLQLVPSSGRQYYPATWDLHQDMSETLANIHDDDLNELFTKQQAFLALANQRNAVWASYQRQEQKLAGTTALTELRQKVAEELSGLNQALEIGLQEAQALGCIGSSGPPKCDWSPKRFVTMLENEMMPRRDADLIACQMLTNNQFGPGSFVRNASALNIPGLSGDHTISVLSFMEYMNAYRTALLSEARLVRPYSSETRRSDSRSCGDSFGNSNFGASYECEAGWEFDTTSVLGTCTDFRARVYAYLQAEARLFSTNHEILYASAEATASPDSVGYDVLLRVLSVDVYHPSNTYPTSFSVTKGTSRRQTFFSATARFVVLYVPVSVSAGVSGKVGVDATLSGRFDSGCKFTLSGELDPYARLDAFVQAAIDVVIASAGVRGELTLVKAELPFDASLSVYLDTSGSLTRLMFGLDSNLQLKLSTMDGEVSVFVTALGMTASHTLGSFHGLTSTTTLMDEHRIVPLASFL